MALLNILCYPDPRLHTVAKPVTQFDDALRTLVAEGMIARADDQRYRVTAAWGDLDSSGRLTERLIANGAAYSTPAGDVYFRVRADEDYGKLSHRNIEELRTGTRFEPGEEKEFPLDFALWKGAKPGEPAEVAAAVAFLAGEDSSFITGQTIYVNGGASMG